jgi:hypothetical protein
MRKHRVVSAVLWIVLCADAVRQGYTLTEASGVADVTFSGMGWLIITFPVVFFSLAPLWLKGHPFDAKPVREWVNRKYGPETYESYTRAIRPMALFAVVALIIGTTCLLNSIRVGATESSYINAGFFLSAGVGFLVCRTIIRRQGSAIE